MREGNRRGTGAGADRRASMLCSPTSRRADGQRSPTNDENEVWVDDGSQRTPPRSLSEGDVPRLRWKKVDGELQDRDRRQDQVSSLLRDRERAKAWEGLNERSRTLTGVN